MNEFGFYLLLAFIGFWIGGIVGAIWFTGFFPAAWAGAAIGFGICPCCILGGHIFD